ncbi:MAG: N-methyl-L-tryptophan oxidase [Cyanobacteria bacterium SZAS LIN-2]|nr:N-methyl-L-tryptophan oxidase [Cyanobacteria bacterium SZAS LIN-3]MBS1995675.1 N-methyl-L-tryptophan oxidase [Cyanobacteria bacterium SZAS LIN-2]
MTDSFDTIVLGLGAVGSAALYQLARRGDKVLGIDQFDPPHTLGSTHGESRITRQAIGEGEQFTPISLRSYEIFRDLEAQSGAELLRITGGLMISSPSSGGIHNTADFYKNTLRAAKKFDIRHDELSAADIRKRFPQFVVRDDEVAYYEYEAGVLSPEKCVEVQLALAAKLGANIRVNECVLSFNESAGGNVSVTTDSGTYHARQLVVCAGPWVSQLVDPQLSSLFQVQRQVQFWFDVDKCYDSFAAGAFPVFIWELSGSGKCQSMYGFPALDGRSGGFKIGTEGYNKVVTTDTVDRNVSADEMATTYEKQIRPFFSPAVGPCIKARVCLYTSTPDTGFIVDKLPGHDSVIVCSPCSGHGFKHSAAIGESVAELVLDGSSRLDLSRFGFSRFDKPISV